MKKTILKLTAVIALFTVCKITTVNAEEIYYTNENGIAITQEQYQMLSEAFTENEIATMPEKQFILETENPKIKVNEETIYVETRTFVNTRGEITETQETLLTEEEYESINPNARTSCGSLCWETTYKKLTAETAISTGGDFRIMTRCQWKKLPQVKVYDVIATRWQRGTTNFNLSGAFGSQSYSNAEGTQITTLRYSESNVNVKTAPSGAGISMNLADNAGGPYDILLTVYGKINSLGTISVATTYQHAQTNVNLDESQSYTFAADGLGGVLKFNSNSTRDKYDKMAGLSFTHNRTY